MRKLFLLLFIFYFNEPVYGQIKLPHFFDNHMVLQREKEIPIWGSASPGTKIKIKLANHSIITVTDNQGKWMLHIPPIEAGGPFDLKVYENDEGNPSVEFYDILIGDVWLASGQSNMEWQVQQSTSGKEEIPKAYNNNIRFFKVPHNFSLEPLSDVLEANWKICDSTSVKDFSAVAYFFSKKIQNEVGVPIGIIQSTWGGTPVEAWTSREMLYTNSEAKDKVLQNDTITIEHFVKDTVDLKKFWDIVYNPKRNTEITIPQSAYDDSDWKTVSVPGVISDWEPKFYEGMIWLRKNVNLKSEFINGDLSLNLGHPEMNYTLYFNGAEICKNVWNANESHSYTIPNSLVKNGENCITLRMAALWGGGGLNPPAEDIYLSNGEEKISLTGKWKYKKNLEPIIPKIYYYHQYPTYIFNGMLNPIIPFGLKGFIWYQGENNEDDAFNYRKLFPMLITDWRIRFQQGYLPFLFVQLPNYYKSEKIPSDGKWAVLRESQYNTLSLPNTGMTSIIDLGEAQNIHPTNKKDVGNRLATVAEKMVYGKQIIASGPKFKSYQIEENEVHIQFTETGKGLTTKNNKPAKGFAIAGKDKKFFWAKARIEENKVVVISEKVKEPVAIRYGWANNPEINLINSEGLPAIPFRTDNWKVVTEPD